MNVLLITEYFPRSADCEVRGGVEARCFYIARELATRHRVQVLCTREPGEPVDDEIAGISVRRCGPARTYKQAGSLAARAAFLAAAIRAGRRSNADVVDGYNFIAYVAAHEIGRARDIPRIATYHDVWLGEWIDNMGIVSGIVGEVAERFVLAQRWDGFIANSEATRQKLVAARAKSPLLEVVHNGIALAEFRAARAPKHAQPTISYVGRLVRYKRVDDLLQALAIIRHDLPAVRLEIVGSGPEEGRLRALIGELRLEAHVELRGFVPRHRDVLDVMARSHVLCLPSAVEGFGMAVIEAMACGTPVVASALAPIREITREGQGSLLFPSGDVPALAAGLTTMLTDDALRARRTEQAIALAADYDWQPLASKVEAIYSAAFAAK